MKKVTRYIALILLTLFLPSHAEAQVLTSGDLVSRLRQYVEVNPWEEVYLHVDRDKYIAGEDIWFSIFAVNRETGKLSARSSIAYVELYNVWNVPIAQKRFRLSGGRGEGMFVIPDSISSGTYTIRSYTNRMKNFLPENCFMHNIDIYNPFNQSGFRKRRNFPGGESDSFNIRFYPEGGNLINGVKNRIAVHCCNDTGEGIAFSGIVRNNRGDSVTMFTAGEAGFSSFFITPEVGISYSLSTPGGIFSLPSASSDGLSVSIKRQANGNLDILINCADNKVAQTPAKYILIINSGSRVYYLSDPVISDMTTRITLSGDQIPEGVANLSLISADGRIMSERLFYSPRSRPVTFNITADSLYGWRQKLNMNWFALNQGQTLLNDWSISAAPSETSSCFPGIDDFMVFGTEYGTVPWHCMQNIDDSCRYELTDNFLICSENRWIKWEDVISGKQSKVNHRFEEAGHYLSAWIRYRNETKPGNSEILYMSVRGKIADFMYARRDSNGIYKFILPVDAELRNLIIQPEYADRNMILELESSFPSVFQESSSYMDKISGQLSGIFSQLSFNYQAAKIYETRYSENPVTIDGSNQRKSRFYGIPETEIYLDDYISLPQMQEVFIELLPGIILKPVNSGYEIKITNPVTGSYYIEPPLVMIDGLIINDLTVLADLNPELVEKIEVVSTPYLIGDLILHGIVNVITWQGDFSDVTLPDFAVELPYRVVDRSPVFVSPDYSVRGNRLSRIPDLRNTLYWNPSVKTGKDGKAGVEFWTPDYSEQWTITINGVTGEGEPVTIRKTFNTE